MNTMQHINVLSLTSNVTEWLADSHYPCILHIFDHACNLINERREVLSIVTQRIGNGPFNLVVEDDILFSEHLNVESPVSILDNQLTLGDLIINTTVAKPWNPRPDWGKLHARKDDILDHLTQFPNPNYLPANPQFSSSLVSNLCSSLVTTDISAAKSPAAKLAGLGIGLTPAGDDFIMGALYASWIIHPFEIANVLAKEIAETAAPLTTSLSAAWLRSAGKGEVGILWHDLFNALIGDEDIQSSITNLLAVGETSGADALAGFIGTFISYAESETKLCPS